MDTVKYGFDFVYRQKRLEINKDGSMDDSVETSGSSGSGSDRSNKVYLTFELLIWF